MIVNAFIELCFKFLNTILDKLPLESFSFDYSVMTPFLNVISNVAYFIPWSYVTPIITFIIAIQLYRILISLVKLVIEFVPFM